MAADSAVASRMLPWWLHETWAIAASESTTAVALADAIRKRTAKLAKNGSIAAVYVNADFNLPVGGADIFLDRIKRQTPGFAGTLKGSTHQATVLSAFGCTT